MGNNFMLRRRRDEEHSLSVPTRKAASLRKRESCGVAQSTAELST